MKLQTTCTGCPHFDPDPSEPTPPDDAKPATASWIGVCRRNPGWLTEDTAQWCAIAEERALKKREQERKSTYREFVNIFIHILTDPETNRINKLALISVPYADAHTIYRLYQNLQRLLYSHMGTGGIPPKSYQVTVILELAHNQQETFSFRLPQTVLDNLVGFHNGLRSLVNAAKHRSPP